MREKLGGGGRGLLSGGTYYISTFTYLKYSLLFFGLLWGKRFRGIFLSSGKYDHRTLFVSIMQRSFWFPVEEEGGAFFSSGTLYI